MTDAVGAALRNHRKGRHLSLDQLARAAGVSKTYLSQIETGRSRHVSLDVARRIGGALGVPLSDLWPHAAEDAAPEQGLGPLGVLSVTERVRVARVLLSGSGYVVVKEDPA